MRESKIYLLILIIVVLLESITHFGAITSADSLQYFNVTRFLLGIEVKDWDPRLWITRPLIPAFTAPLSLLVGLPAAFGIINSLLMILSSLLYYEIALKLTNSKEVALIAALMLATSFIAIAYGASSGKEGGGIFFQVLSMFLFLNYLAGVRKAAVIGLISGIGGLAYETIYAVVGFGFALLLTKRRYREAIVYLAASLAPQIIPPMLGGYNIIERYIVASLIYAKDVQMYDPSIWFSPVIRGKQFIAAISPLGIICLLLGFLFEKDHEKLKLFYLMTAISTLAWLSWPPNTIRTVIVFYHAVYWLAALGLKQLAKMLSEKPILRRLNENHWIVILLSGNIIFNNWLVYKWYLDPSSYTRTWGPIPGLSIPSLEMLAHML